MKKEQLYIEKIGAMEELIELWDKTYDFILPYLDYGKMIQLDSLAKWHSEYLQVISNLKSKIASLTEQINQTEKKGGKE